MKLAPALAFAASLALAPALAPTLAHADSLHTSWEKYKAGRSLRHLSNDGQHALVDILQARDLLAAGQTEQALPALYDATKRFTAARKDSTSFTAAENALQPAPQHPQSPTHVPVTTPTVWVPVGGEFVATETLAPATKAAASTANAQLKTGNAQQAAETMQVVNEDVDFIVALAPLDPTQGAVNRATVFAEGRDPKSAVDALDQALSGIVFVADDSLESAAPSSAAPAAAPAKPAK